jgi:uncharacterized membrane protein
MRTDIKTAILVMLFALDMSGCTGYTVRDLGAGTEAYPHRVGLNNYGSVVATRVTRSPNPNNIFIFGLYNQGTPPNNLEYQVDNATFQLATSWGGAINDAGFSVGYGGGPSTNGKLRGIVLSGPAGVLPGNQMARLEPLSGYGDSSAYGINNYRMVVGHSEEIGRPQAATLWPGWEGGTPIRLGDGLPTNFGNFAVAINNSSRVVGYYFEGDRPLPSSKDRPWFRSPGDQVAGLPPVPPLIKTLAVEGRAYGINDSDLVVGEGKDETGAWRGWVWRPSDGAFTFLPGTDSGAYAINSAGVVVGRWGSKACLWPNLSGSGPGLSYGEPIDLNGQIDPSDVQLGSALQINASGQIVVLGGFRNNVLEGGHVFLLTPR